jgi:two-component system sensor histidine kinase PhoQ
MISLRARVSLAAALVLAVFIGLTALALERAFEESARSSMRERLFAQVYLVMAAAEVSDSGRLAMPGHLGEPRLELPGSGLYATIANDNKVLWRSPSALGLTLPEVIAGGSEDQFTRIAMNGDDYFRVDLNIEWETDIGPVPLRFQVLENSAPFVEQMSRYRQSLWGWLGALSLLLLLALVAALVWGLRPLRSVAAEVHAIESGRQGEIEQDYPKELKPLTDNINTLLQHERAQQSRYKHALADLAHSLKTPLAVLRGLSGGTDSDHLLTLQDQVSRMDNIVQYQLQRAATAGRSALAAPQTIAPTAERLIATLEKVYRDRHLTLHSNVATDAAFRGEEGDLMELLGNLLDNACKWAKLGVWLTARRNGRSLEICVEDDGPGIEAAQAEMVLSRGGRLDETTPGHGIGLPMVRDIVEAYGGRLEIGRSEHGGARFLISLPA